MNKKEARIGNVFYHKKYGMVNVEPQDFNDWDWGDVIPQSISESILKDFGCKIIPNPNKTKSKLCTIHNIDFILSDHNMCQLRNFNKTIRHIHEFQNIIFDLTGNEVNNGDDNVHFPNKDTIISFAYTKTFNGDYKKRMVFKSVDDDNYYSGFMDCYDWIEKQIKSIQ